MIKRDCNLEACFVVGRRTMKSQAFLLVDVVASMSHRFILFGVERKPREPLGFLAFLFFVMVPFYAVNIMVATEEEKRYFCWKNAS